MNYGFFIGAGVFCIITAGVLWWRNAAANLDELRAFAFLALLTNSGYNANGANRIAASMSKRGLICLAPGMRKYVRLVFSGHYEKMMAHAVENGFKADYEI